MHLWTKATLAFGILALLVTYSLVIAYSYDVREEGFEKHATNTADLLARRDELISLNKQLEDQKIQLQTILIQSTQEEREQSIKAALEEAAKTQQAIEQAATQTTTVQSVPVTTKKVVVTTRRATTRAS